MEVIIFFIAGDVSDFRIVLIVVFMLNVDDSLCFYNLVFTSTCHL